ncbi:MAG: Uma2 family endonuclease [Chloroflexi bacterium CFX4]|nr:Uma2 family endonuclease [Chloroflexi bacterium CFX4]MDL1923264.1 Uma2 family endonuclease [Chloroflexi bacterium CFX3]
MLSPVKALSVEAFDQFVQLPENAETLYEYIGGEVVEVPSNPFASKISIIIASALFQFVAERQLGHITGEAGGYIVSGERYAPDVAFLSKARQESLATEGYNPTPPDLAVEVDFPSTYQSQRQLRIKIANYLAAGTEVWLIPPEARQAEVYAPNTPVRRLAESDTLEGRGTLAGFSLPMKRLFA